MRISTQMMYDQNMRGITDSQSKWLSYGEQMSTGKRVNRPSDDPIAASQAVVLSQSQSQNSQFALARTFATQKVSLEDNVLSQVNAAITSAKEKLVNAGNGTLSDDDRLSLASDLQGIRDQLMNLANSADGNGRYIFAGYKTEAPPFDSVTGDYNGGTQAISQQVDTARNMVISHTGQQIFESITSNAKELPGGGYGETNMFKILDSAISALKVPVDNDSAAAEVQNKAISDAQIGITNTQNNVLTVVADVGTKMNELEKLDNLGDDRALGQTQQMSDLVDVDWNSAISSYIMQQAALQASYKAFSDMQGMSLFQLNK
ncbi:flagellar hook-associated protein FlgL [Enterobacter cloacae]|jgi:flagellar hook-associated protein 3 FlgL|uniref:Flagellar hook-associated protein FlgL n=2 Tax=Enterobacter cloacae TaxID=550 RepID=A0A1B3F028_ENTCL|nr:MULTISPECIES: flagellar hook-associated protein FlgL [Enterobacter]SSH61364.1 Hook-filament junction protein [Klebsiella pneumoniae]VAM14184.1 flagellar hook-associated protein FlgL [Enterobacter kobei]ADF62098.1 flagellar hook-associated protein FlgL [Enterobacter cloacae subsp. cloacae ATCC 13047]AIV29287.1 flagellar hook-associated protein FlgL [Enterobacter cloacae]AOE95113.1 flagellar hook-filament junction protein FlgL [Enterobacter cloacae]